MTDINLRNDFNHRMLPCFQNCRILTNFYQFTFQSSSTIVFTVTFSFNPVLLNWILLIIFP